MINTKKPMQELKVAVVIPCYKVSRSLENLLGKIGHEIALIYCVDDACPDMSYKVAEKCSNVDRRIKVIKHNINKGVGGAMVTGYKRALTDGMDIVVKVDGDGQMNPAEIERLIRPLVEGRSDYAKGNRFYDMTCLSEMPKVRLIGNILLSFLSKFSTGYWHLFDPTNGFTAIQSKVLKLIPLDKLNERYFFETDFLFRLNIVNAVVHDIPMNAKYGDEESNLKIHSILFNFPFLHLKILLKRIFYNYFLRNFSIASINLVIGLILLIYGLIYGFSHWTNGSEPTSAGVVMMAALPIIIGMQSLLSFIGYDMSSSPEAPLHLKL